MVMEQPSAVRFFAAEHPRQPRSLRQRLEARLLQLNSQVLLAADWGDFKYRAGQVAGVLEDIELCKQMEKELEH
jgi:hypothetical protein